MKRVLVPFLAGVLTGSALWAVTGYFVTLSGDVSGEWCGQVARALMVPGAVVGGIIFVVVSLACPPGRVEAITLLEGALGGAALGVVAGMVADFFLAMASTGLLPSFMLPLMGTSVVTGAVGAWFGGWLTTEHPRQR